MIVKRAQAGFTLVPVRDQDYGNAQGLTDLKVVIRIADQYGLFFFHRCCSHQLMAAMQFACGVDIFDAVNMVEEVTKTEGVHHFIQVVLIGSGENGLGFSGIFYIMKHVTSTGD